MGVGEIAGVDEELPRRFVDQFAPAARLTVGGEEQGDHVERVVPEFVVD